jgi:class 3 adenylate cyclase
MARLSQNMSVLFADICESTKLYNTLGDDGARAVVDACLSLVSRIVESNHGAW